MLLDEDKKEREKITKNLKKWLSEIRKKKKLTLEQIAYKSGISVKHIERMANGRYLDNGKGGLDIRIITIKKLSKGLDISVPKLVEILLK